jgi:hypothetical protein
MRYNEKGQEVPNNTPVALPLGYSKPQNLQALIARMVRQDAFMKQFEGEDTEEEANDFECEDDEDLNFVGKYEMLEMQEEYLDERTTAQESAHNNPESGSDRAKDTGDRPNEAKDENLREDGVTS